MRYLLCSDEERAFLTSLRDDLGLVADRAPPAGGFATDHRIRHRIRRPGDPGSADGAHVFWAREVGPLRRLSDRPESGDALGRGTRRLSAEAGGPADVIDLESTPAGSYPAALARPQPR